MNSTRDLLLRWHAGDLAALGELVAQEQAWITERVHQRLGAQLRARADTQDLVQHTLLEVLRAGPRFVVDDRTHLRALLARMVENSICYHARFHRQQKRDMRRDMPLPGSGDSASVLDLAPPATTPGPATAAASNDTRDWVRLALELLEPEDRNVIQWREYDGLPFAAIAERLAITEAHARVRFQRALPKLGKLLAKLRNGRLAEALAEQEPAAGPDGV